MEITTEQECLDAPAFQEWCTGWIAWNRNLPRYFLMFTDPYLSKWVKLNLQDSNKSFCTLTHIHAQAILGGEPWCNAGEVPLICKQRLSLCLRKSWITGSGMHTFWIISKFLLSKATLFAKRCHSRISATIFHGMSQKWRIKESQISPY